MNRKTIIVAMSTFNEGQLAVKSILSIFASKTRAIVKAVVVDDGSNKDHVEAITALSERFPDLKFIPREHRERGLARCEAIEEALKENPNFIVFLDADMILHQDALQLCVQTCEERDCGAVLIREVCFSNHKNFVTKVKVFERNIINNSREPISSNSIEAARFWRREAWLQSGGLNEKQVAFEEIQPTIRYLKQGGRVERQRNALLYHDEKEVTFESLFSKKGYYFSAMYNVGETEEDGFLEMLQRWYPFRTVYYERQNVKSYVKHPILASGVFAMYSGLTAVAVKNLGLKFIKKND